MVRAVALHRVPVGAVIGSQGGALVLRGAPVRLGPRRLVLVVHLAQPVYGPAAEYKAQQIGKALLVLPIENCVKNGIYATVGRAEPV